MDKIEFINVNLPPNDKTSSFIANLLMSSVISLLSPLHSSSFLQPCLSQRNAKACHRWKVPLKQPIIFHQVDVASPRNIMWLLLNLTFNFVQILNDLSIHLIIITFFFYSYLTKQYHVICILYIVNRYFFLKHLDPVVVYSLPPWQWQYLNRSQSEWTRTVIIDHPVSITPTFNFTT